MNKRNKHVVPRPQIDPNAFAMKQKFLLPIQIIPISFTKDNDIFKSSVVFPGRVTVKGFSVYSNASKGSSPSILLKIKKVDSSFTINQTINSGFFEWKVDKAVDFSDTFCAIEVSDVAEVAMTIHCVSGEIQKKVELDNANGNSI